MIVSLFSDLVGTPLFHEKRLAHLGPVFNKLCLPLPQAEDYMRTREQGILLFNEHAACPIRFYPHKNDSGICEHIYHPDVLPPLGLVRFPEFTLQVMPGIELLPIDLSDPPDHPAKNAARKLEETLLTDIGSDCDSLPNNMGYAAGYGRNKAVLLDTILDGENIYSQYDPADHYERYRNETSQYSRLQELFYEAWTNTDKNAMEEFWEECEYARKDGLLHAGWRANTGYRKLALASCHYSQKIAAPKMG